MAENENQVKTKLSRGVWFAGAGGFAVGLMIAMVGVYFIMPSMMIVTAESNYPLEETVTRIENRANELGWVVSGGHAVDMNKSLGSHGVDFEPAVRLVKICHPDSAKSILTTDRHISCLMPCTLSVWQSDEGTVYLSKMNIPLMAKMFGGNVAKVMGGKVSSDEAKILEGILRH